MSVPEAGTSGRWNYRVARRGTKVAIYEAYYDSTRGVTSLSEEPVSPEADDLDELRATLELLIQALDRSVLEYRDISGNE